MNENINLCEILKGCEGIELYSSVYGYVTLIRIEDSISSYPIIFRYKEEEGVNSCAKDGLLYFNLGECTLFPSKEQRDWSKFERPIPIDTPMMCSDLGEIHDFSIRFYAGKDGKGHYTFTNGGTSQEYVCTCHWKYMIPFDRFNPNDIEESLKYNVQV